MPTIRERLGKLVLREQYQQLTTQAEAFRIAYEKAPHWMSQQGLLSEVDTQTLSYLQRHMGYDQIASWGGQEPGEEDRRREVKNARWYYQWDPVTGQAVALWTDFGFGQTITITPNDPAAEEDWTEFWRATRNRPLLGARKIHKLSNDLLVDGELFLAFFVNKENGESTLRSIDTLEITELVRDPEDKETVLYYRRDFTTGKNNAPTTWYYPDWQAEPEALARAGLPKGAIIASDMKDTTDVVVLHVAMNEIKGRGWPLMTRGAPWSKAYWNFLQDRAAIARKVAMYVDKLRVKGGSRALDAVKSFVQSSMVNTPGSGETNPPATAGSDWLENEAVKRERLPQSTGAGDARIDGMTIVSQAGIGMGITNPALLGRPDAMQNRATARELAVPMIRRWDRYQLLWGSVWRDMVEIVLTMKEKYGGASYEDKGANVSTDASIQMELDILSRALIDLSNAGLIPKREAALIILKRPEFGIENADELINVLYPKTEGAGAGTLEEIAAQLRELAGEAMESDTESAAIGVEVIGDLQSIRG